MSFAIKVDIGGIDDLVNSLEGETLAAARPAAQAGAQVLYDEVRRNVAGLGRITGNLAGAVYQAFSEDRSSPGRAVYHISWNQRKAPHGGLVEYGYIQRYATYVGKDGKWHTAVRPEMRGKNPPSRRAAQAVKDAYYVTLDQPKQVAARAFVRSAAIKLPQAQMAAEAELRRMLA